MRRHLAIILKSVTFVVLLLAAHATVVACRCYPASDCRTYTESKAVFLGVASEILDLPFEATTKVTFTTQKVFKGVLSAGVPPTLTFTKGNCQDPFKQGELYLVFQDDRPVQSICNRTELASKMERSLGFLKQVERGNFRQQISAVIIGLSPADGNPELWVNDDRKVLRELSPKVAEFAFAEPKLTKVRVRLRFPFLAGIEATDGLLVLTPTMSVSNDGARTTVEYEVDLTRVVCDSRRIELIR